MQDEFHHQVSTYYDKEACSYEGRHNVNETIHRIRESFREVVLKETMPAEVLEVGVGVGFDIVYFAQRFPDTMFYGIDISEKMLEEAQKRIDSLGLKNVELHKLAIEDIARHFGEQKFDLVYVFFGALNTTLELQPCVDAITKSLKPGGRVVSTFVNKFYFSEFFVHFVKFKYKIAFRRLRKIWGGYSLKYFVPARLYFPRKLKKAFSQYRVQAKRGYSITYPAWYQDDFRKRIGKMADRLWRFDLFLNKTPFWKWGEYVLFDFRKK